jgi:hypothetical protein
MTLGKREWGGHACESSHLVASNWDVLSEHLWDTNNGMQYHLPPVEAVP